MKAVEVGLGDFKEREIRTLVRQMMHWLHLGGKQLSAWNLCLLLFGFTLLAGAWMGCEQGAVEDDVKLDTGVLTDTGNGGQEGACEDDGLVLCDGECRDLLTDSRHCGECDNGCESGYACQNGHCELICPAGQAVCDDGCHNLQTSPQHCGECNAPCEVGESCVDGECQLVCPGELVPCSGVCVDLGSNTTHCGACDAPCDTGVFCVEGVCQLICPLGMEICFDQCVYMETDPHNCGACGVVCGPGKQCLNGECTLGCGVGQTICSDTCVSLQTDRSNCGACGTQCASGQACFGGECVLTCPDELFDCNDTCVNLLTDRFNCGWCGNTCPHDQICNEGICAVECAQDEVKCAGACVDVTRDRENCGECGYQCGTGLICEDSECILSCPGTQVACDLECVYTDTDIKHCGGCNQPCAAGQVCSGGECGISCGDGFVRCGGSCADLMFDRDNCGSCGFSCLASQICTDGECVGACPAGFEDCGECANLSSDDRHCGACNNACTGNAVCRNSACYLAVASVTLNHSSLNMLPDQQASLVATILPPDATDSSIVWQSSDGAVAIVDETGLVTAVGPGTTTITAGNLDSGHHATCLVTVNVPVTGVEVTPAYLSLLPGGQEQLTAVVLPANATNRGVSWNSLDQSLVTVDANGLVRAANREGEAIVTVTTADGGFMAEAVIAIAAIPVTGVNVEPTLLNMIPGETASLTATLIPEDATNTNVIWTSSSSTVAKVHNTTGVVTAVAAGQAVISAITADGGYADTCTVTVSIPVTGVSLSHEELTMNRGENFVLVGQVHPVNATNTALTWSSDDPMVASVSNDGAVTAVGAGLTTIRISSLDGGYTAVCIVEVLVPVTGITVSPASLLLWPNEQGQLEVAITPDDATEQGVVCSSFKREIAEVDCRTLTVTAVATGSTMISVTSIDSLQTALMQVNVARPVSGVNVSPSQLTLRVGQNQQLTAQVSPVDATEPRVIWESGNPQIATVNLNGKVTSVARGETVILARTIDGGLVDSCNVTVKPQVLYEFTTHTFTNCSATGQSGPSVTQCKSSYSSKAWTQNTAYFNVTGGIQLWTVPATGTYQIEVWGAQGGTGNAAAGGKGARMRGDFMLQKGERLRILVGQLGSNGGYGAGGGGGSFVVKESANARLIIAGGGGGGGRSYNDAGRSNGTIAGNGLYGLRSSGSNGGAGGTGGGSSDNGKTYSTSYGTGGGGGFNTNGTHGSYSGKGGNSFLNGGAGGARYSSNAGHGGFGGGAGGSDYSSSTYHGGGGGGGYAGGGGGYTQGNGGGGGSYNGGTNPSNTAGTNSGHGKVAITLIAE